jgi:hypothetical protein
MIRIGRLNRTFAILLFAAALVAPAVARAGDKQPEIDKKAAPAALKDAGLSFEAARLLTGPERQAGLEELDRTVGSVLRGDLSDDEKAGARALSAQIRFELQGTDGAEQGWRGAAGSMDDKSFFKDDAEFAAIHMKELKGNDKEAADERKGWMDRYPQSPLRGEAMLAQAWNALRRGDVTVAAKQLATLSQAQPWLDTDPRVTLAKGTLLYTQGKPVDALAAVGIKTSSPAASYLRGLCYRAQGAVLQSAASFQEVADRSDSPPHPAMPPRRTRSSRRTTGATESSARDEEGLYPSVIAEAEASGAAASSRRLPDSSLAILRGDRSATVARTWPRAPSSSRARCIDRKQYPGGDRRDEPGARVGPHPSRRAQYAVGRRPTRWAGRPTRPEATRPSRPLSARARGSCGGVSRRRRPPLRTSRASRPGIQIVLDRYVAQMGTPTSTCSAPRSCPDWWTRPLASSLLVPSGWRSRTAGGAPHMPPEDAAEQSPWRAHAP